jgi:hypothetical protein
MKLEIGRRHKIEVSDFAEASRVYTEIAWREVAESNGYTRAGDYPFGRIDRKFYVSWNGTVWNGSPKAWKPGDKPVYRPANS